MRIMVWVNVIWRPVILKEACWKFEWRWKRAEDTRHFAHKLWDGSPLKGKNNFASRRIWPRRQLTMYSLCVTVKRARSYCILKHKTPLFNFFLDVLILIK